MNKIIYGRSPSMIAKHERELSENSIVSANPLILREMQDRPMNEAALRGVY